MTTPHKPCTCPCCPGTMWWREMDDLDAELNWYVHYSWCCDTCGEYVVRGDLGFIFPED